MANSNAGKSSGKARVGQYQVFLNFCGQDTRDGFTEFLYQDLVENCINVFMDDEELPVGEEIGEELPQAIDNSQIYIPIFSRNYASSKWCLRELARMVDNASKSEEKKILPIFYNVEPKDVDLKTPLYRTAIEKHKEEHKEKFPDEGEYWEGESWEDALKKVDKIKGWELKKCKSKAELMKLAVKEVLHSLKRKHKIVTKDLVGLDDQVAEVLELLDVNCSDEVRLLKVHGMGGIGKTTLAGVVYNELSSRFGKCCAFLDNIRETSKKEGLFCLQKKLLSEIANSSSAEIIKGVDDGRERIEETLGGKKVLIVLDDVDEEEQIKNLIGQRRLHPGTRVIITTRIISVLEFIERRMACERKEMNFDLALPIQSYEMKEMNFDHALQLFKRHVFVDDSKAKDFDSLSRDIVNTTGFLPLAIEVIGSLLFGKPKAKWEDTLKRLKKTPHKCVQEKLMISYEALNHCQREIFLDVACFFINEDMVNAKYMWEACGFDPTLEIDVLVEMSLIKIKDNDKFWMHDQLRDLGREIVRRNNPKNFKKQSRVWTSEEFLDFIRAEERYEDVEAFDLPWTSKISISPEEIRRFKNLRFMRSHHVPLCGDFTISLPKLRWISWHSTHRDVCGLSMHSKDLVVIELFSHSFTDDSKVWDLIKMATKLKNLTLVYCHGITRTPDLSKCLDLERLTFDDCQSLMKIDDSIGKLKCLLDLNITDCWLERVPDEIGGLVKLERFSLKMCRRVSELPASIGNLASLRELDLSGTELTSLPESIGDLASLRKLRLSFTRITTLPKSIEKLQCLLDLCLKSTKIRQLPNSIGKLTSLCTLRVSNDRFYKIIDPWELPKAIGMLDKLEELYLHNCGQLVGKIPDEIGGLSSLRVLNLSKTRICRVPGTINRLFCLSTLNLTECNEITELPELPVSLVCLSVQSSSLQVVPNLSKLTNLVELVLSDGSKGQDLSNLKHTCDLGWIGRLSKLKKLELCLLDIAVPPTELGLLSLLEDLALFGLDLHPLEQLPPSLLSLKFDNFGSIGPPQFNLKFPSKLTLCLSRLQEIQLYGFSQLQNFCLENCDLKRLSITSGLRTLRVIYCLNMIEIQFLGMSASLEEVEIYECQSIGRIVLCGEGGSHGILDQSGSSSNESTDCSLGVLLLPNSLKRLKRLKLRMCKNLVEIQVIGTLLSLQDISIQHCRAMEKLTGISNLKNLHHLLIFVCSKLRVVEGLDKLEFLTEISVHECFLLETLFDISNSKIPDKCEIVVSGCRKSLNSGGCTTFEHYKRMAQQGAPQSETNKEKAKMEGDAEEPNTELQLQLHPFASSQDHDISKEPPIDKVKEGTLPGNQNRTRREPDSKPQSLDELARPRTFSDSFKTCLVCILECVCNRDFT